MVGSPNLLRFKFDVCSRQQVLLLRATSKWLREFAFPRSDAVAFASPCSCFGRPLDEARQLLTGNLIALVARVDVKGEGDRGHRVSEVGLHRLDVSPRPNEQGGGGVSPAVGRRS